MLIGSTAAMTTGAMALRFGELFGEAQTQTPSITVSVAGASMIALSLGVRLPQRIAVWVCANAWRRVVTGEEVAPINDFFLGDLRADRPLYWIVLSVVALVTGVLVVTLPVSLRIASAIYAWLGVHFLWPAGPLALLQSAMIFAFLFLPLALLGVAVSCAHYVSGDHNRWETSATAWLIIGAGWGVSFFAALRHVTPRTNVLLIAGALPALLLSLIAALACSRYEWESNDTDESMYVPAPIAGLHHPRIVRIGIVAAASTTACLIGVSLPLSADSITDHAIFLTLLLLATGLGILAGCGRTRHRKPDKSGTPAPSSPAGSSSPSIRVFGATCLFAGILTALSTVCGGLVRQMPVSLWMGTACAGVGTSVAGLAMAYGRRALIVRVANRSSSGAAILARSLMYVGLTFWIFTPTVERIAGPHAPPMVLALVLVVVGGMLATRQADVVNAKRSERQHS